MWEAIEKERTNKGAKAIGRKPRFGGAQGSSGLSGDELSAQLRNYAGGTTTASKRSQPVTENSPTKKMRLSCDPVCGLGSNNTASSQPHAAVLAAIFGDSGPERHDVTALQGPWRQGIGSHPQRCPSNPFKTGGVASLSYRSRLSPYTTLETAQQRRVGRTQDKKTKDLQKIKRDARMLRDRIDCVHEESNNSGNESPGRSVSVQPVTGGAIPKKRYEESNRQGDVEPTLALPRSFNKNALEAESSMPGNIETGNEKAVASVLNIQDPKRKNSSGTLPIEDRAQEGTESTTSESDLTKDELAAQLMDSYVDSQTMVRSLRQMNEQYAEKIEALNMQLSQLENRCLEDKLRTELHCAELQQLREESAEKLADMRRRAETFEKQHNEDQRAIEEHQQQLATLSTQLELSAEKRRLEQNRFERLQLDSQRELASQQQTLASCQRRLERLDSVISRQRECLECSICLGLFSEPVTLGCGHTFCELCIMTNQRSAVLPQSCPLCRQFIGSPARSAVISQLIDLSLEMERCQV